MPESSQATSSPHVPKKAGRPRKIAKWFAVGFVILVALVFLTAWLLLTNLNTPFVRSRVLGIVKDTSALNITYEGLDVSVSGEIRIQSLTIAAPERFREHMGDFLSVTDVHIRTSFWDLAFGNELAFEKITARSVNVVVGADETGATTLSELFPGKKDTAKPEPPSPAVPLSHSLGDLPRLVISNLGIEAISLQSVQIANGAVAQTTSLSSLSLTGAVRMGFDGLVGTSLQLAGPESGVEVAMQGQESGDTKLVSRFSTTVASKESGVLAIQSKADLVQQNLLPHLRPVRSLWDWKTEVAFVPDEKRTTLRIRAATALDGAASIDAEVTLGDEEDGSAVLTAQSAIGLRLDELPVHIEGVSVSDLNVSVGTSNLRFANGQPRGTVTAKGQIGNVEVSQSGERALLRGANIQVDAAMQETSGSVDATVTVAKVEANSLSASASVDLVNARLDIDVMESTGPSKLVFAVDQMKASNGEAQVEVENFELIAELAQDVATVLAKGPLSGTLRSTLRKVSATRDRQSYQAQRAVVTAALYDVVLSPETPTGYLGSAETHVFLGQLDGKGNGQRIRAKGLQLGAKAPLTLATGSASLKLTSMKRSQGGTPPDLLKGLDLSVSAENPLALLPDEPSKGTVTAKGQVLRFAKGARSTEIPRIELSVKKPGEAKYNVNATALVHHRAGANAPKRKLTAKLLLDGNLRNPELSLRGEVTEKDGAIVDAAVTAKVRRNSSHLTYNADITLGHLDEALGAKVSEVRLKAHGNLRGVVTHRRDTIGLTRDPVSMLRGQQSFEAALRGLTYDAEDVRIRLPSARVLVTSRHGDKGAGEARLELTSDEVTYEDGVDTVTLRGLTDTLTATFDAAPSAGTVSATNELSVKHGAHSGITGYVLGNATSNAAVAIDKLRTVTIQNFAFKNPAGQTSLRVSGSLERAPSTGLERRFDYRAIPWRDAVSLTGQLRQGLSPLRELGVAKRASGNVSLPFRIESGDLSTFRVQTSLVANDVSFEAMDGGMSIEGLNGVIPVVEEVSLLPTGMVFVPGPRTNALSHTRFFDVHPFLDSKDYITLKKLRLKNHVLGPLAGNVRLLRSVFSVDQLHLSYRGGIVTGQLQGDVRDRDPRLTMRLNAVGIKPTKENEPLDANLALTFMPQTLTLQGKVQLLRIGRRNLLALLDVLDPYRETVNANKVRLALQIAYPKFVRLQLHDGVVDMLVKMGGLGKAVRLGEIRAVPLGPLMQSYVADLLPPTLFSVDQTNPEPKALEK